MLKSQLSCRKPCAPSFLPFQLPTTPSCLVDVPIPSLESEAARSPLLDQRLVTTGLPSPSPSVPHKKKLGPFYAPVLLRCCSTCGRLRSSSHFSRRLPSLRTTAPSNPRLRSPVRVFSLSRTNPLLSLLTCVRFRRSQSRVHAVLLRSLGPVRQHLLSNMAARDAARERYRGPGLVGQNLAQHTDEHSAQGAAQREHYQRDI